MTAVLRETFDALDRAAAAAAADRLARLLEQLTAAQQLEVAEVLLVASRARVDALRRSVTSGELPR